MDNKFSLVALALSLGIAACSPLAPQPDQSRYFILTPLAKGGDPSAASPISNQGPLVGVGPIDFPDYLRRTQVVTRDANQIKLSARNRWAEPLDMNFQRTLVENLSTLLHTQRIEIYPWPRRTPVDYQVVIYVERFEATSDGSAQMAVRWIIKDGAGKDLYASETRASTAVPEGPAGVSVALSGDLEQLSTALAARIDELNSHRGTQPGNT
jgi:uncharacterized protein